MRTQSSVISPEQVLIKFVKIFPTQLPLSGPASEKGEVFWWEANLGDKSR